MRVSKNYPYYLLLLFFSVSFFARTEAVSQTNNALHFLDNDGVFINNNVLLNPVHITLQAYVRQDYSLVTTFIIVKDNTGGATTLPWQLKLENSKIVFRIKTINGTFSVVDPNVLQSGSWVEYTGTYDGIIARLYKNGILIAENSTTSGDLIGSNSPVNIGSWNSTSCWGGP